MVIALLPTVAEAAEFKPTCTDTSATVSRVEPIRLLAEVEDPVLSMTQSGATVVVGRAAAIRLLTQRAFSLRDETDPLSSIPLSKAALTVLEMLTDIDAGSPVAVEKLYPPLDDVPSETQRANILMHVEFRILFLLALRDGEAAVRLDGRPVDRATATIYTAHDAMSEVSGVRIGHGTVTFLDYCTTLPR